MTQVRTRFAPSPTGYMHLGNLRTALYTYLYARRHGGTFILRIEDTDQERETPGAIDAIYRVLSEVGLAYDEGPDVGGEYGPYIQTQRRELYGQYARKLVESGHAYPCFCTKERLDAARADAEKRGETFKYDKHCLGMPEEEAQARIAAGEPYVIRQNIPLEGAAHFDDLLFGRMEVECAALDDNVLIKADGLPTYNFANVVDDHLMQITHVLRGSEYLSSAPKYNLLYQAFGWQPPAYIHLPPVMKDQTRKLSKRKGDPTYEDLISMGYLKDAVVNYIALLGWSPGTEQEFFTLEELTRVFDAKGVKKSPSIFDMDKLTWFNAEYMRKLPLETYMQIAKPWFMQALDVEERDYRRLAELVQGRTEVLNRIPDMVRFLAEMPEYEIELYTHKKMKTDPATALSALQTALPALEGLAPWTESTIHEKMMEVIAQAGMKNGQMLWPLRIAISGLASTPGGAFEIAYLLGKEETLRRLKHSVSKLEGAV